MRVTADDVETFLDDYPGMSFKPSIKSSFIIQGKFSFSAAPISGGEEIIDSYQLEMSIPFTFPRGTPTVRELDRKIPRDGTYHINPDNTLCLGSPLRLLKAIFKKPTLAGFAENCLVPYLYAVSNKLRHGGDFIFKDLAHGSDGIVNDYREILKLENKLQIINSLRLLGLKRRVANKKPCPCGCRRRLGKCPFHLRLNVFREMIHRSWFRAHAEAL